MKGFFYFCGKLKTTRFSWYAYLQPDMKTATLLGDKWWGEDSLEHMLHSIPTANIFICSNMTMGQSVRQSKNTRYF